MLESFINEGTNGTTIPISLLEGILIFIFLSNVYMLYNIARINKKIRRILLEMEMLKGHQRSIANFVSHLRKSGDILIKDQFDIPDPTKPHIL